jgi:alanyl aminopeptidase
MRRSRSRSLSVWLPAALAVVLAAPNARALTDQHRLDHRVVPTSETLRLEVDARRADYSGSARIALRVTAAADSFQFHALDLQLEQMTLHAGRGTIGLKWSVGPHGVVTARTAKQLAPGAYTLDIDFTNDFGTRADALYKLQAGGESYVASQFEAIGAREAFPCWDEPEFKIPWQLTLVVPRAHIAISNTPEQRDTVVGEARTVEFERTPPLPSYLVAILAGPWETVPIPGMSVPGRIVTPKGATGLAGMAVRETPKLVAALERYFGVPYPYKKLDLIAVPEFWAGAMENAGAITFRDRILLVDPAQAGASERKGLITITAHELAHMWFGDYVTMRWWDDLWLNESFASWLGDKVSHEVAPEFELPVDELEGTQRAMERDAQRSTRAMRAQVDGFDNLDQLFDELTYQKGQAVLGMTEQWLGPDAFQKGVREYITAHAWGSAEGADLWNALSKASGQDVSKTVTSFLDQGGMPIIEVTGTENGSVGLRQVRFYTLGPTPEGQRRWFTPVTLKYSDGTTTRTQTVMMSDTARTVRLKDAQRIAWLDPNADERGYYRWFVERDARWTLADHAVAIMSTRERVGFVNNLSAGLDADLVEGDEVLQMLGRLAADPKPQVVGSVIDALDRIRQTLITPEIADAFAFYVRKTLRPALDRIGMAPAPGETEPTTLLRPRLMQWVGRRGRDPEVLARARTLADAYLRDPEAVNPSLVETVLRLSAADGDTSRFGGYQRRFEQAKTPGERSRFLNALGSFRDTMLIEKAMDYTLSPSMRPNEMYSVWGTVGSETENQERSFRWMTRNYDKLATRMPPFALAFMIRFAQGCSAERLDAAKTFFTPARRGPGFEVELAKVNDHVTDCVTLRKYAGGAIRTYLEGLNAPK